MTFTRMDVMTLCMVTIPKKGDKLILIITTEPLACEYSHLSFAPGSE